VFSNLIQAAEWVALPDTPLCFVIVNSPAVKIGTSIIHYFPWFSSHTYFFCC